MKNRILIALAAASCILASCQVEVIQPEKQPLVFSASIQTDATRTAINIDNSLTSAKVTWVAGDEITVTCGENSGVYVAQQTGETSTFTFKTGSGTEFDDESATYTATYGDIDNQSYSAVGANCPMSAPATVGTELTFTESAAMLKFSVRKTVGVSIKQLRVAGKYLNCDPAIDLGAQDSTDFYIAIPAGSYTKIPFTFVNTTNQEYSKKINFNKSIPANTIQPITISSSAITFTQYATYYNTSGKIDGYPTEGVNTSFSYKGNSWKLTFSNANDAVDPIDWENGAILEAGVPKNDFHQGHAFAFGDDNGTSAIGYISAYYAIFDNQEHYYIQYKANDVFGNYLPSPNHVTSPSIYMKLSKTNGFEYSLDGTNYTKLLDAEQTQLNNILTLGTGSPFYFGTYAAWSIPTYSYLKVTRPIGASPDPISVTGVSLSQTSVNMTVGDEITLTETVSPSNAANKSVTWTVLNESESGVITVSNGTVHAEKVGTAQVKVTTEDGDYSAICDVTVTAAPIGTIYFDINGNQLNSIQEIEFSQEENSYTMFALPEIDWTKDVLEISMVQGTSGVPLIIGNLTSFTSMPNYSGSHNLYMWTGLIKLHNNEDNTLVNNINGSNTVIVKITNGQIEYWEKNGETIIKHDTVTDKDLTFQDKTTVPTLYLGAKNKLTGSHINYVKLIRGN